MDVPTAAITEERLNRWKKKLEAEHATLAMLIGFGHDHAKGRLVVCVPDEPEFDKRVMRAMLLKAAQDMES